MELTDVDLHRALSVVAEGAELQAAVPFAAGVARSVAWLEANPHRKVVDSVRDAALDRILAAYETAWATVSDRRPST